MPILDVPVVHPCAAGGESGILYFRPKLLIYRHTEDEGLQHRASGRRTGGATIGLAEAKAAATGAARRHRLTLRSWGTAEFCPKEEMFHAKYLINCTARKCLSTC